MTLAILAFTITVFVLIVQDGIRREQHRTQKRWDEWSKTATHRAVVLARDSGYPC